MMAFYRFGEILELTVMEAEGEFVSLVEPVAEPVKESARSEQFACSRCPVTSGAERVSTES